MKSQCPFSRVVLVLLFLAIGFTPYILGCLIAGLGWLYGGNAMTGIWDNELFAWDLILAPALILAIITALTLGRRRRTFATICIIVACCQLSLYALGDIKENLKPQTKADVEQLELIRFLVEGGWLGGFVILPFCVWYLSLLHREHKRARS